MPQIGVDQLAAGLRAGQGLLGGENPITAYSQARQDIGLAEAAREQQNPVSTTAGNVVGDIGTILTGRLPMARAVVGLTKSPAEIEAARAAIEALPPAASRHAARLWNSAPMTELRRAAGKAAETGFEGATLSMLHQGDPVETGAYAAGGQLAGSFALSLIKHPYRGLGAIAATTVLWQMMKNLVPGGRDRILESAEDAIKHATWGTLLGGMAAVLGAGRYRGSAGTIVGHGFAQDLPKYAEGVNAALRASPTSLIEQFTSDEKSVDPVMSKITTDITAFTPPELQRLSTAMEKGNLADTINSMLANSDFARRMGMQ